MTKKKNNLIFLIILWTIVMSSYIPLNDDSIKNHQSKIDIESGVEQFDSYQITEEATVFEDNFNEALGYNDTLWDLESYGNGSVSWIEGEYFNMTAERHSFRTLSSKQVFSVGKEAIIRMRMREDEAIVCVGFTNTTAETGWNYLFWNSSLYIEEAQNIMLLTKKLSIPNSRVAKILSGFDQTEFHTYRLVWNSSAAIAYIDGIRVGAIGGIMPTEKLHFKIAITENRNQETEGWICVDSIKIREHTSMVNENPPFITLNSPSNDTLNLGTSLIDVVPVGSDGLLYWSWDGTMNESGTYPTDIRLPTSEGIHTLDVYCQDGYGYGNWAHVRYVFSTMVNPDIFNTVWCRTAPTIDGVIQSGEWPISAKKNIEFVRVDGQRVQMDIYFGSDDSFVYIAFDSPIPSGHDSRAAIILNGAIDGHYNGSEISPIITAFYTKGSPQAWIGYDELKYIWEEENEVRELKVEPIPIGFLSFSSEQESTVHYEFRVPLDELNVAPGATIGMSLMLFPTGLGVDGTYFPITYPWTNASKLAHLTLANPPNTILFFSTISISALGLLSIGIYLGWKRLPKNGHDLIGNKEDIERIIGIIESYEIIEIKRLSQRVNLPQNTTREIVQQLIDQKEIDATINDNEIIRNV